MTPLQSFPTACRECLLTEGWPVRAHTMVQLTGIRVDLRCRACGHLWTEDLVQPPNCGDVRLDDITGTLLLRRKPERQKGNAQKAAGPFRILH